MKALGVQAREARVEVALKVVEVEMSVVVAQ